MPFLPQYLFPEFETRANLHAQCTAFLIRVFTTLPHDMTRMEHVSCAPPRNAKASPPAHARSPRPPIRQIIFQGRCRSVSVGGRTRRRNPRALAEGLGAEAAEMRLPVAVRGVAATAAAVLLPAILS